MRNVLTTVLAFQVLLKKNGRCLVKIVTEGMSRIVFIYKDIAIKFPWINVSKIVRGFLKHRKQGTFDIKIRRFHKNKVLAALIYVYYTLTANRREYLYSKKHSKEETLIPIAKVFFFGLIVIQPRVEVLNGSEQEWKVLSEKLERANANADLLNPRNFCVLSGRIRLIDYAYPVTQRFLDSVGFGIIAE